MTALVITYCVLVLVALAGGIVIGWCFGVAERPAPLPEPYRAPESNPLPAGPAWPETALLAALEAEPAAAAERLADDTGELAALYGRPYPPGPPGGAR